MKSDSRTARCALLDGIRLWLCATALSACSDQLPPPSPPSFARPLRVAFTCFDTGTSQPAALADCAPNATTGALPDSRSLHALVTQSDRGEVAAVDLRAQRIIDSRNDIPGYTFVPVGELPGPIAISPVHPNLTYVANTGSRDISVLTTSDFRSLPIRATPSDVRMPLRLADDQPAAAPVDMLMSPDEDALFVSAPESSLLLRVPIQPCVYRPIVPRDQEQPPESEWNPRALSVWGEDPGCGQIDSANIVSIPIGDSFGKAPAPEQPLSSEEPYSQLCGPLMTLPLPAAGAAPQLGAAMTPQPAGLALDAFCDPGQCQRRLLVADKALPIIHVLDIDALAAGNTSEAVLPPIVTGVPTERVAVTPRVPIEPRYAEDAGETQYVYAIDAQDGSVLVTQNGRLLYVSSDPSTRPDRVDVGQSATGKPIAISLEILTPRFLRNGPGAQWVLRQPTFTESRWYCGATVTNIQDEMEQLAQLQDTLHPKPSPVRLRGVFLAVGLTDGTVRIVDVHDMELAECRNCDKDAPEADLYQPYPIRRHHQRVSALYSKPSSGDPEPHMTPAVLAQYQLDSSIILVNSDGTTNDPRIAGLDCVTCPENESVSFPAPEELFDLPDGGVAAAGSGATAAGGGGGSAPDSGMPAAGAGGSSAQSGAGRCVGQPVVCSLADPWVDPTDWNAYYEGSIPGTRGGRGRFVVGGADSAQDEVEFFGEARFCDSGVLGDEDIGDADGDDMEDDGDQVAILSNLLDVDALEQNEADDPRLREDCEALITARDEDKRPIAFRIKRAYADHLVIAPNLLSRPSGVNRDLDYPFVQRCFQNMLMTYDVRLLGSYLVVGGGLGFLHRVKTDPDTGRCAIDGAIDPRHDGRAYDRVQFDNGYISFKTLEAPTTPGGVLQLLGASRVPKLYLDASAVSGASVPGVMPVDLRFNPIDEFMYVVDISQRGLIAVRLDPFPSAVLSSYQ